MNVFILQINILAKLCKTINSWWQSWCSATVGKPVYVYGDSFGMDFKTNTVYHKECTYNSFDLELEASLSPLLLASLYISGKNPEKGWE